MYILDRLLEVAVQRRELTVAIESCCQLMRCNDMLMVRSRSVSIDLRSCNCTGKKRRSQALQEDFSEREGIIMKKNPEEPR